MSERHRSVLVWAMIGGAVLLLALLVALIVRLVSWINPFTQMGF